MAEKDVQVLMRKIQVPTIYRQSSENVTSTVVDIAHCFRFGRRIAAQPTPAYRVDLRNECAEYPPPEQVPFAACYICGKW